MEPATPPPLPPEIRVEQISPDEVRYVLPRRPLGNYRWLAVAPLGCALFGIVFTWGWIAPLAQMQLPVPPLVFQAFVAIFAAATVIMPIAMSLAILVGHSSVEIRCGKLWTIEHVGWFRWGRKRPLMQVRRLLVGWPNEASPSGQQLASPPSRFAAVSIETTGGKPRLAAMGYPREWLVPLAHELGRLARMAQTELSDSATNSESRVEVVDAAEDRRPGERLTQPAGSLIVMTEQPGSLTFEVPPVGIRAGAKGLFTFACLWLAFMTLCTFFSVKDFFWPAQPQQGNQWILFPVLVLFWSIGFGLMLLAVHIARWRAAIAVADGRCLVLQVGLFSETKQVWEAGELVTVQVGPSGMEVNDKPVMELQFIPRDGKKFGVMSTRDEAELEWLATRLTKALGLVPARPGPEVLRDVDTKPPHSNVSCEQAPESLKITIPRSPLRGGPLAHWVNAVVCTVILTVVTGCFAVGARIVGDGEPYFAYVIAGLLSLVNVGMYGLALHMTIRRAAIAFAAGRLLVLQFGLFGKHRHQWAIEELAAVRAAVSGTKAYNRPLMQLQIVPVTGKTVTLLTGRDDSELAWIATLLRRTLKLPAETDQERGV